MNKKELYNIIMNSPNFRLLYLVEKIIKEPKLDDITLLSFKDGNQEFKLKIDIYGDKLELQLSYSELRGLKFLLNGEFHMITDVTLLCLIIKKNKGK